MTGSSRRVSALSSAAVPGQRPPGGSLAPKTKVTVTRRPSSQMGQTSLVARPTLRAARSNSGGASQTSVLRSLPRSTSRTTPVRMIRYSTSAVTSGLTARDGDLGSEVTLTAARLPPTPRNRAPIVSQIRHARDGCVTRILASLYRTDILIRHVGHGHPRPPRGARPARVRDTTPIAGAPGTSGQCLVRLHLPRPHPPGEVGCGGRHGGRERRARGDAGRSGAPHRLTEPCAGGSAG